MNRREFIAGAMALGVAAGAPASASEGSNVFYIPDFHVEPIETVRDNTITLRWPRMIRWDVKNDVMESANIDSVAYAEWMKVAPHDIPPHIQFGGAVVANPPGDPEFFSRWQEYARTLS